MDSNQVLIKTEQVEEEEEGDLNALDPLSLDNVKAEPEEEQPVNNDPSLCCVQPNCMKHFHDYGSTEKHWDEFHYKRQQIFKYPQSCNGIFKTEEKLVSHGSKCRELKENCKICGKLLSRISMNAHMDTEHSADVQLKSTRCAYKVKAKICVDEHLKICSNLEAKKIPYRCCNSLFNDIKDFADHQKLCKSVKEKGQKFKKIIKKRNIKDNEPNVKTIIIKCVQPKCKERFLDYNAMEEHWKKIHSKIRNQKCSKFCNSTFTTQYELFNHLKKCEDTYDRCKNCDESTMRKNMKRHQILHHSKDLPFRCTKCGFGSKDQVGVNEHMNLFHPEVKQEQVCVESINADDMNTHILEHPLEKIIDHQKQCSNAEEKCREYQKNVKRKNMNDYKPKIQTKMMQCVQPKCMEQFADYDTMEKHWKEMHSKTSLSRKCTKFCNSTFSTEHELTDHLKNCGDAYDRCNDCVELTSRKNMKYHQILHHSSDLPFKCIKCGYGSEDQACVNEHMKNYHPEVNLDQVKCEHCVEWINSKLMNKHVLEHHSEDLEHACFCGYRADDQDKIDSHLQSYHPNAYNHCLLKRSYSVIKRMEIILTSPKKESPWKKPETKVEHQEKS